MSLSIGLDLCPICGDAVGGIPTFIRQLVQQLLALDANNRYYQCYKLSRIKGLGTLYPVSPNFKRIWYDKRFVFPLRTLDVFHGTAEWLPPALKKPRIMTVHDMRGIRSKYEVNACCKDQYRALIDPSVKVVTDSQYIRNQMLERLPEVSEERVSMVPLACDPYFKPMGTVKKDQILFVGSIAPNKNVLRLVMAFDLFRSKCKETTLVLCGRIRHKSYYREVMQFINSKYGLTERIQWRHDADRAMLRMFYNESRLCILPSLYDGFGIPVLEAQVCGCPMVCSTIGPFKEIGAQSVLYCDPEDTESIATAICSLLQSETQRRELVVKGFENSARFSWEKTAREYMALYNRLGD